MNATTDINSDPLMHCEAAAQYLGLVGVVRHPGAAVRTLARKRRIESVRICGKIMLRKSALDAFILANTRPAYRPTG